MSNCLFFLVLLLNSYNLSSGVDYEHQNKWGGVCNSGKRQSPIDIRTGHVRYNESLFLKFVNYDQNFSAKITNSGHSAKVNPIEESSSGIELFSQSNMFSVLQFHFHWKVDTSKDGSEHAVDGEKYPLEMHIVHLNNKFKGERDWTNKAMADPNGLAVVGILFKIGPEENPEFEDITQSLKLIKTANTSTTLNNQLNLYKLLPSDKTSFYTYPGSLTTPPCSESVTWVVMKDQVAISIRQLNRFNELEGLGHGDANVVADKERHILQHNLRSLQPLGKRTVQSNTKEVSKCQRGSSSKLETGLTLIIVSIVSIFIQK